MEKSREVARIIRACRAAAGKDARREINYFDKNKERMRYKTFREKGHYVGSGAIEAACRTVFRQRLKQSGMEWAVQGANAIATLRLPGYFARHGWPSSREGYGGMAACGTGRVGQAGRQPQHAN